MLGAPVAVLVILFRVLQVLMDLVVAGIGGMIMRKGADPAMASAVTVGATQNG